MSFTIVKVNITTVAVPLLPSLTDVFVGKVLTFSLLFKLSLHTSFLSIFSTSVEIALTAMFPIELLSSANADTYFNIS